MSARTLPSAARGARRAALALLLAAAAGGPIAAHAARAPVTYLAGGSVYVGAGRADGLAEGDTLQVAREGRVVARLRVSYLSTHSASCDTLPGSLLPAVGEVATFRTRLAAPADSLLPEAEPTQVVADTAAAPAAESPPVSARSMRPQSATGNLVRGRVGVRFLAVRSDRGADFTQPALDLRLDGTDLGGSSLDLSADVRGRRTVRSVAGAQQVDALTSVYRLSGSVHDARGRRRLTLGRQSSPTLAAVSLFDGALAELGGEHWTAGLFGGTQPEPAQLGLSADVIEHGGFLEWRQAPLSARRWSLALGGVASYQAGQLNRDFVFTQAYYRDPRLNAWFTQEVDVNYGWKRDLGARPLSPTSTFLSLTSQLPRGWALRAGYDGRRSVRLYRDRETPETQFDDRLRQGAWAGASWDAWDRLRLAGDGRVHDSGGERGLSWSASAEGRRLLMPGGRAQASYSFYRDPLSESWIVTARAGFAPRPWAQVGAGGGTRESTDRLGGVVDRVSWWNADLDLSLARRLWFNGSLERTRADFGHQLQSYLGLSWRF